MDLTFSSMSEDTSLAQKYFRNNEELFKLFNNYLKTIEKLSPYVYNGKAFEEQCSSYKFDSSNHSDKLNNENMSQEIIRQRLHNLASSLKHNGSLFAQLENQVRNIPIEDTMAQVTLLIQNIKCQLGTPEPTNSSQIYFSANDSLLAFGSLVDMIWKSKYSIALVNTSRYTAAICHLIVTLCHEAGIKNIFLIFQNDFFNDAPKYGLKNILPIKGLDSGTVAVVSDDADVDSAVDKFLSSSKKAPWRLRKILVQENVYQQFKDALRWKCTLKSTSVPLTTEELCSETLIYDGRTFLIDPVKLLDEKSTVVSIEAYRTTKEMISLVLQDKTRYLSLWTNGIAEINEVTHATQSPVVWVNTLADFRGPPQVSEAVYSHVFDKFSSLPKCKQVVKLCEMAQSWRKLNIESRLDILCDVLEKYIEMCDPTNKVYTDIRNSLLESTMKCFVDVGKDYICTGLSQPVGVIATPYHSDFFSARSFKSLLQGNAFILVTDRTSSQQTDIELQVLAQMGVPVIRVEDKDEQEVDNGHYEAFSWFSDTRTRVVWTNTGTIFAN